VAADAVVVLPELLALGDALADLGREIELMALIAFG
jgi:hypothetical protein